MVEYATAYIDQWTDSSDSAPSIRDYWRELVEQRVRESSYVTNPKDANEYVGIAVLADMPIGGLRERYEFRNGAAVRGYLRENPSLCGLLKEARDKIAEHFGDEVLVVLDLVKGFEADDDERLFVFVQTELSPDEALDHLDELYEEWWLGALATAQPKFSIDVEYI